MGVEPRGLCPDPAGGPGLPPQCPEARQSLPAGAAGRRVGVFVGQGRPAGFGDAGRPARVRGRAGGD